MVRRAVVFGACRSGGDDIGASFAVGQSYICLGCCRSTVLHICGLERSTFERGNGLNDGSL